MFELSVINKYVVLRFCEQWRAFFELQQQILNEFGYIIISSIGYCLHLLHSNFFSVLLYLEMEK